MAKDANPAKSEPVAAKPEPRPIASIASGERLYTVQKGDTFERIANVELGSKKRTADLMRLNAGIQPKDLRVGQRIKLPGK